MSNTYALYFYKCNKYGEIYIENIVINWKLVYVIIKLEYFYFDYNFTRGSFMKKQMNENIFVLFGYAIICNGNIHIQQLKYLDKILKKFPQSKSKIDDILLEKKEVFFEEGRRAFEAETLREKKKLVKQFVKLMCLDGSFDKIETNFISALTDEITCKNLYVKKCLRQYRRSVYGGVIRRVLDSFLGKILNRITRAKTARINKKCYKVSRQNLKLLETFMEQNSYIQVPVDGDTEKVTYWDYEKFYREIEKVIQSQKDTMNDLLQSEITIALIGKTKAGKSSVFSLVTGYGQEFIGEGLQRTTRFATAGSINGIRITDTPGLSAMETQGRISDEKKAMNILEKADLVCVVIPTDSISTELKEVIKKIAQKNKPIHVIFNKKGTDMFEFVQIYQEFMKNPYAWINDDERVDNMSGHKNDMLRYAEKNDFANILHFDYVHAYMARVAKNEIKLDWHVGFWEKIRLLKASNYNNTIHNVLKRVTKNYKHYRWQQYFDSTLRAVNGVINRYSLLSSKVLEQKEKLEEEQERVLHIVDSFKNDLLKDVKREMTIAIREKRDEENLMMAAASSQKKYQDYLEKYVNEVVLECQNIIKRILVKKEAELEKELRKNNVTWRNLSQYNISDAEEIINVETEKQLLGAKDAVDVMHILFKIAILPLPFLMPEITPVVYGMDTALGIGGKKMHAPSWIERKEQRAEQRLKEIDRILSENLETQYNHIDQEIEEWKQERKKNYDKKIRYLQEVWNGSRDKEKGLSEIKKNLVDKYAKCYLNLRHKGAKFITAYFYEENKLIIKAKYCKPEIINETCCFIEIINN